MIENLFLFTIGPVQPLIEGSRKGKDMYGGSQLLSDLMEAVIQRLKAQSDVEVIFPMVEDGVCGEGSSGKTHPQGIFPLEKRDKNQGASQEDMLPQGQPTAQEKANIPNRLIAKVARETQEDFQLLARDLENFVKQKFLDLSIKKLEENGIQNGGIQLAKKQLSDFLEVYWLYEPMDMQAPGKRYPKAYEALFKDIQAVKNIRPFSQTKESWGRKCILFPAYNAVFVRKNAHGNYPSHINQEEIYDLSSDPKSKHLVKEGEALSAIAMVKRLYGDQTENPVSIRHMLLNSRIPETKRGDMLWHDSDEWVNALYDLANGNNPSPEECPEQILQAAQESWRWIQSQEDIKLSSYYALLKFDGDDMGTHFLRRETAVAQRKLSDEISQFAKEVKGIIGKYKGLSIYAGGEDFFGILPLDTLFPCVQELCQEFKQQMGLTFSAGIAVAHLMQPLKQVVALVDAMEKKAKEKEGKNAFAVGILKRSGETVQMPALSLGQETEALSLEDIKRMIQSLKNQDYSKSTIFKISQFFGHFDEIKSNPGEEMAELLIRKAVRGSQTKEEAVDKEELVHQIKKIYRQSKSASAFIHILNAMAFLAREVE